MLLKVYNSDYITKSIQMGSPYDPPENVNAVGKYYETCTTEKKINQKWIIKKQEWGKAHYLRCFFLIKDSGYSTPWRWRTDRKTPEWRNTLIENCPVPRLT